MVVYDDMGINPDGQTKLRGLSVKSEQKKNFRNARTHDQTTNVRRAHNYTMHAQTYGGRVDGEGGHSAFHVTAGVICWYIQLFHTTPYMVHVGERITYETLTGFPDT